MPQIVNGYVSLSDIIYSLHEERLKATEDYKRSLTHDAGRAARHIRSFLAHAAPALAARDIGRSCVREYEGTEGEIKICLFC